MGQLDQLNIDKAQKTIHSLQGQISEYIGRVTARDVTIMELQQENAELKKELEEIRKEQIKEMDKELEAE